MSNVKRLLTVISALILMSILMSTAVFAYPSHDDFVCDKAVILDEETEENIKDASESLVETKNTRLAVCTVLTTGKESAKEYATALFKEWEIGNGVLLLLVIEDDTFYAVPSNSVSEVLTQDKLAEILNSTLEPRFAEKEYAEGALKTVNALSVFLNNNLPENFGESKGGFPTWATVLLTIVLIVALVVIGGYLLLVFLEKRNAQRAREEMEARRRAMARGGYGRPMQRPGMPQGQRPMGNGQPRMNGAPAQRPAMPQQGAPVQRPMQQSAPQQNTQRKLAADVTNAATIQINTADIRAARQNRRP